MVDARGWPPEARMSEHEADRRAEFVRRAVRTYQGPLISYAQRFLGDVDAARDVVQEVFLRLCRQQWATVEPKLSEWLFTVCRNAALDLRRKLGRGGPLQIDLVDQRTGPAQLSERNDSAQMVLTILETLPPNQQEVIILKIQHHLSYREISSITGQSVGNVGFLLSTGLKSLRARLAVEAQP
jgi:RNA polymerase sigma factor (sigma-70 family)